MEDRDNDLQLGEKQIQVSTAGRRTMQRRQTLPDLEAGPSVNQIVSLFLTSTIPKHPQDLALGIVPSWPITGAPSKHTHTLTQSCLEGVTNSFFLMHAFPSPKTEQVTVQAGNLKCSEHHLPVKFYAHLRRPKPKENLEPPSKPSGLAHTEADASSALVIDQVPCCWEEEQKQEKMTFSKSLFPC